MNRSTSTIRHRPFRDHRIETLERRQLLSLPPGSLDPTFGDDRDGDGVPDGTVTTQTELMPPSSYSGLCGSRGYTVELQVVDDPLAPMILVGGSTQNMNDAGMIRYNTDGSLDTTFGPFGNGQVLLNAGVYPGLTKPVEHESIRDIAIQPHDGRIVAVGYTYLSVYDCCNAIVSRYTSGGVLDTTFGDPDPASSTGARLGYTTILPTGYELAEARSVAIGTDGRIYVAVQARLWDPYVPEYKVLCLGPQGDLDPAFGTGGVVSLPFMQTDQNGRDYHLALVDIDPGPGVQERVLFVGAYPDAVQGDTDIGLARLLPDGSFDPTWGSGGILRVDPMGDAGNPHVSPRGLAVQPDGKVVVGAGYAAPFVDLNTSEDELFVRLDPDGNLDTSFGASGICTVNNPPSPFDLRTFALDLDGRVVFGGYANPKMLVGRLTSAGQVDTSFGQSGYVTLALGVYYTTADALAVQPDGDIVVAGAHAESLVYSRKGVPSPDGTTARYMATRFIGGPIEPQPGILASPVTGLVTTEAEGMGHSATFTVRLMTPPAADTDVTIAVASSNTSEGTVSPASLTFTPDNWNTPQPVTITEADENVADGDVPYTITLVSSSADPAYTGLAPVPVSVTNRDNDGSTYTDTNATSTAIPDAKSVTSTLAVPATGTITGVTLTVQINHQSPADLALTLVPPDGSSHPINTLLANGINTIAGLTAFNGLSLNGTWKLIVTDRIRNKKVGTLQSWTLDITYTPSASMASAMPAAEVSETTLRTTATPGPAPSPATYAVIPLAPAHAAATDQALAEWVFRRRTRPRRRT